MLAPAAHEESDGEVGITLDEGGEAMPAVAHPLVPRKDAGVHGHETRDALGALEGRHPQADRTAPVLHDERHLAEVELVEQRGHGLRVPIVGVPIVVDRLVRAAETREVRRYAAAAGLEQKVHDFAP